jgi:hypothetical protein
MTMALATPAAPAPAATMPAPKNGTNDPVERGRYTAGGRERILWAQRVEGRVCLTDAPPAGQRGRCYIVEDDLTVMDELDAIVADYLAQAAKHNGIPAHVLWRTS